MEKRRELAILHDMEEDWRRDSNGFERPPPDRPIRSSEKEVAIAADKMPRVLCVDDEPSMLDVFDLVPGEVRDLAVAENGEKALEIVDSGPPFAAVLTDFRMPGMD